jgi:predicted enzyme related to lactoylglutathione lyase
MAAERGTMANTFGSDILIQAKDPREAAEFYVKQLGFTVTDDNPKMVALHGDHVNLFIEPGPALGPVLEVTVPSVAATRASLVDAGCQVLKDEPAVPRVYLRDPYGLIYNLTE